MKMYILIKEEVPLGLAMTAAAHASLAMYLKFMPKPGGEVGSVEELSIQYDISEWLNGPFKKVICKVNEKEFEKAKEYQARVVMTESALDDQEVAIAFAPREEWPKMFNFLKLYR